MSRDHKPDLTIEKDRILKAGGFIHAGRVNGSLNLARAIGRAFPSVNVSFLYLVRHIHEFMNILHDR